MRVSLIATSGTVSLPLANLKANGGAAGNSAGTGTIYLKNATDVNGALLVGNNQGNNWSYQVRHPKKTSCTASSGCLYGPGRGVRSGVDTLKEADPFPSTRWGGENDVLDAALLSIEATARVKLTKSFRMDSATVASGTSLDLNGYTLTVKGLTVAGVSISSGIHAATDFASCVTDSAGTSGRIVVMSGTTLLMVR